MKGITMRQILQYKAVVFLATIVGFSVGVAELAYLKVTAAFARQGFIATALTLVEAAKLETGDVVRQAIIELYAGSSDILMNLPFDTIPGNAMKYNRESSLPGVGFRGVNEAYTPSTGVLNPLTEALVIAGGDLDVDKFIVDTMGMAQRSTHEAMKIRALSLAWTKKFIKGDTASDPREFDGLQVRITGDQKIPAGTTDGGDALSLAILDQAIDQTLNPTHLLMSKAMRRRLTAAARTTTVGGYVTYEKDAFGRTVTMYNDLPIMTVDLDNAGAAILGFTEVSNNVGVTATGTSIYVLSMGDGAISGLQNGGVDVRDMGELQTAPVYRTRVEWYNGFAIYNGRAATRIWSIKDAAIVV
jgi:hypothetical protein